MKCQWLLAARTTHNACPHSMPPSCSLSIQLMVPKDLETGNEGAIKQAQVEINMAEQEHRRRERRYQLEEEQRREKRSVKMAKLRVMVSKNTEQRRLHLPCMQMLH